MTSTQILERKFGMLAVKKSFATKEQINRALKEQKRLAGEGEYIFLGDILIQAEVISEKQRDAILESQKELKERKDRENIVKVLQLIRYVNQELNRMKAKMRKLLEDRDQLDDRFKDYKSQIKNIDVQIKKLQDDLINIIELAKMRKSTAIVNVTGTI